MDASAIYRKTAKGLEEMATRAHRLPARERSLLVLVDGRSTGAQLLAKTTHLGDPGAFLDHLIEAGFVEPVGGGPQAAAAPPAAQAEREPVPAAPVSPPPARPAAPPPAPAVPAQIPREAMQFARRYLIDTLGPDADALTARLEACRSGREAMEQLAKCRDALQSIVGRRKAEDFWNGIAGRMPKG